MSVAHRCIGALAFTLCVATGVSPRATTPAFKSTGSMHVARAGHQATLLRDGRVIVTGGHDRSGNAVAAPEIFDPPTAAWALAGANIIARLDHTATRLSDGRVLVAGGLPSLSSCEPTPIGEVYDATTQQWSPTRNLPVSPGAGATAVALASGRLLLTGGTICGRSSNAAMLYDPSGNTWSAAAPMRASRAFHSALLLADGRALVVGGGANESVNAEIYDPAQATWTTVDNGAAPRAASCGGYVQTFLTVLTNALVLAAGGITGDCATGAAPVSSAEVFDLATARWSSAGHVEFRRALTSPTLLPDGRVLLAGGYTDRGVVAASELFDPATGAWEVNGRLQTARAGHTATRLTNGTVLIAGGSNSDGRTATAEIYLPEISYAASAMAWPRGFSGPTGTSFFGQPWGIATNAAGHTFLSYLPGGDRNILEWARPLRPAPGGYLSELGGGQERVHSIRIDDDDDIWAIGGTTNTITQFDAAGRVLLRFGAAPPDAAERGQPADEATPYL